MMVLQTMRYSSSRWGILIWSHKWRHSFYSRGRHGNLPGYGSNRPLRIIILHFCYFGFSPFFPALCLKFYGHCSHENNFTSYLHMPRKRFLNLLEWSSIKWCKDAFLKKYKVIVEIQTIWSRKPLLSSPHEWDVRIPSPPTSDIHEI